MQRTNSRLLVIEARLHDLMVRGLAGDERSYAELLSEAAGYLRGYFGRRLSPYPADVEDLVQETLIAVHNRRHTYDDLQPFTGWLYAIARYKLVDLLRARASREALSDSLDEESEAFAKNDTDAKDAHIDIEALLAQLPDRYRLPILHVKLGGLSVREAARLIGMSESAVKVGIHRGLKALAAGIRDEK